MARYGRASCNPRWVRKHRSRPRRKPKHGYKRYFYLRNSENPCLSNIAEIILFFYHGTRLLKQLLLRIRRNSGSTTVFDQITHSPSFSPIRENGGWESLHASVVNSAAGFREISLWEHGRSTSNGSKSGYARPFGKQLVLACAHGHGEHVGHLTSDPPPLSETAWPFACKNTKFRRVL